MTNREPQTIAEEAKTLYQQKQFEQAALLFREAANAFTLENSALMAAEIKNNESVSWLMAGKPQEALNAANDTDKIFAEANDLKRQAIALSNQAAALVDLKKKTEALVLYEQAFQLFDQIGEKDMRAYISRAISEIKMGQGKITESAIKFLGSLESKENPTLRERILRSLLRLVSRRIFPKQ